MHSVEMVRRQAAADAALQERIQKLAKAQGRTVAFDTSAARGDANLKRLLWMEQAAEALDVQPHTKGDVPEIVEPDGIIVAAVEVTEEPDAPKAKTGKAK